MEPASGEMCQPYARPKREGCRSQMSKWGAHVRSAVRRRGRTREAPFVAPPGPWVKASLLFASSLKWLGKVLALLPGIVTERGRAQSARCQVEKRFALLVEAA